MAILLPQPSKCWVYGYGPKNFILGLERRLSSYEYWLFIQRTWIQFQALHGNIQLSVTPVPRNRMLSLASPGTRQARGAQTCIQQTPINNKGATMKKQSGIMGPGFSSLSLATFRCHLTPVSMRHLPYRLIMNRFTFIVLIDAHCQLGRCRSSSETLARMFPEKIN